MRTHEFARSFIAISLVLLAASAEAEEILLRESCGAQSPPACFTDLASVLAEIHQRPGNGRTPPGPTHPVVVDIGAGVFDLTSTAYPYCSNLSNLSFRGTGKDTTILTGGGYPSQQQNVFFDTLGPYVVLIEECGDVDFSDLMIRGKPGVSKSGIRFAGNGGTWWNSIRILINEPSQSYPAAWFDSETVLGDGSTSMHHFTDVQARVIGDHASGFWITGSRHEFRASHIRVDSRGGLVYGGFYGSGDFDLSIEGSLVEIVDSGANAQIAALWFTDAALGLYPSCSDATARVAGSQIRVSTTATSGYIHGIANWCDEHPSTFTGHISARGTQFVLEGNLTRARIAGNRPIDAPYDLGSGANPPAVTAAWSDPGQDRFIETDCGTLCAGTAQGSEFHELLFDPTCNTAGPWLDTVTGLCRGL